jgi:hypothetical protein
MKLPNIETVSAKVHEAWMDSKRAQGVTTRQAEDGEELMVPYSALTEKAKELDRGTVKAVYAAIEAAAEQNAISWSEGVPIRDAHQPDPKDTFAREFGYPSYEAYKKAEGIAHVNALMGDGEKPAALDTFARSFGYANYQAYDEARDTAHGR